MAALSRFYVDQSHIVGSRTDDMPTIDLAASPYLRETDETHTRS
jgi:hypothetical protein